MSTATHPSPRVRRVVLADSVVSRGQEDPCPLESVAMIFVTQQQSLHAPPRQLATSVVTKVAYTLIEGWLHKGFPECDTLNG